MYMDREIGVGVGVGVMRGGVNDTAMPSPMLMTTNRLMIKKTIRIRRVLELRTMPPGAALLEHSL